MCKISIIVPCYNAEKYIKKCINSILNQTYLDYELFLINDGSTDNTASVIEELIKNKNNCHYFYKKNGGVSSARNFALKKIKSKYVCFIDSDDYLDPLFLQKLYTSIENENSDIAVCGYYMVYPDKTSPVLISDISDVIRNPAIWNKIYKTDVFTKNKICFPKQSLGEDLEVIAKLIFLNSKFSFIDCCLYNYVQNSNSITHTIDGRVFHIFNVIEKVEEYFYENNCTDFELLEFMNIYHILINTTYRIFNHKNYSINMLIDTCEYVKNKYPNWYKNKNIKNESYGYRFYLYLIKKGRYKIVDKVLFMYSKK